MEPKFSIAVLLIVSIGNIFSNIVGDSHSLAMDFTAELTEYPNLAFERPMEIMVKEPGIKLSREEKLHIVQLHNTYRSNVTPPAANMRYLQWDKTLAKTAEAWANRCVMRHGIPESPKYHDTYGQNLYYGASNSSHRAMWLWYNESHDYDLHSAKCAQRKTCGHYIQMMWWETKLVGCALAQCGRTTFIFVCHYYPQYLNNTAPYSVGEACSLCDIGYGGLCNNSLCVTKTACESYGLDCECHLKCHNCGRFNNSTCSCECMDGWDLLDCSKQCKDKSKHCGKKDGYSNMLSCPMYNDRVKNEYCRKMCQACVGLNTGNLQKTCCDGMSCSQGYVIDLHNRPCSCKPLCPGPQCYFSLGHMCLSEPFVVAIGIFAMLLNI